MSSDYVINLLHSGWELGLNIKENQQKKGKVIYYSLLKKKTFV